MSNKLIKTSFVIAIVSICVATLLTGCNSKIEFDRKVGFVETQINNNWKSSFRFFDGSEEKRVYLEQGESLVVEYKIEVKKGELELVIEDETDNLLLKAEDTEGELIYKADDGMECYIIINAIDARGSFEISWDVIKD